MLVYANHLIFQGNGAEDAILRAVKGWLSEQLGFNITLNELKKNNEFQGSRRNRFADHIAHSWLKIYTAVDDELSLYAWIFRNEDDKIIGRQWITEIGLKRTQSSTEVSCVVRTEESSTLVNAPVSASRPRLMKYLANNIKNANDASFAYET